MKKTKKLALNRETLRRLDDAQASAANGGVLLSKLPACTTTDGLACPTNHPVGCGGQTNKNIWC